MATFGTFDGEMCVGCAATNAICEIAEMSFQNEFIDSIEHRSKFLNVNLDFLYNFEQAIDCLRGGGIKDYNYYAKSGSLGFATIDMRKTRNLILPELEDNNWREDLHYYEELATRLSKT